MEQSVRVFRDPVTDHVVSRYAKVVVDDNVYWAVVFTPEEVEAREDARRSIAQDGAVSQAEGETGA